MAASNFTESWLADKSRGLAAMQSLTSSERFEMEAMPHLNGLFRSATRMVGERSRAEDVVQEVFLQAWRFRFPLLKETEEFIEANLAAAPPIPDKLTDA
jgi:Sigma-70 region 2